MIVNISKYIQIWSEKVRGEKKLGYVNSRENIRKFVVKCQNKKKKVHLRKMTPKIHLRKKDGNKNERVQSL